MAHNGPGLSSLPKKARFVALWLAAVCLAALAAHPAAGQFRPEMNHPSTATLEGRVRTDSGGVLASGVTVRLETSEGELYGEQPVHSNGSFVFENLEKRVYRLTVRAEGFQPHEQMVDLGHSAGKTIVDVVLSPENKIKLNTTPATALTDEQASKQARKEYEKGAEAVKAGNDGEARSHFENAVREFPCYARAQADLAVVLSKARDASGAEAALKKAIECDPGFPDPYAELGQLYFSEKKIKESEAVLQQGLQRSPGAWQFHYQLGMVRYSAGNYARAEEDFLKAESLIAPPPPELHVKLADAYLKTRDYDKAYARMEAYLRAEPEGRFAAKIKSIMRQMEQAGVVQAGAATSAAKP